MEKSTLANIDMKTSIYYKFIHCVFIKSTGDTTKFEAEFNTFCEKYTIIKKEEIYSFLENIKKDEKICENATTDDLYVIGYALLFATIVGIFFNFKTNKILVFKSKRKNVLFRFIMIYGFIYAINYYGIVCIMFNGYNYYISALIILPFSAVLSYMLNKIIVFKNEKIN